MKRQYKYLVTTAWAGLPIDARGHVYIFAPSVAEARRIVRRKWSGNWSIVSVCRVGVNAPEEYPHALVVYDSEVN